MRRVALTGVLAFAFALGTACGGDKAETTDPTGGATGTVTNGTFRATVNGTSWSANGAVAVSKSTGNIVAIVATSLTYTIAFGISQLTAPGTFSLNAAAGSAIATVSTGTAGQSWSTVSPGGTGSVVITTYTANRIAGTFSFTAAALSGTTGALTVTNGSFDVTFTP